ncbi:MAG: tetratricopeptide repeat protein, partial [Endomicrobiia bacterium]|nr:tetratricopeptide repeat protein [Endomicrobiia bacterium]
LIISSAVILFRALPECFYRLDFHAHDYARNVLATARPGAIIYDPDDTTAFATDYFQYVLGRRTDIKKAVYFRTRWGYERLKRLHPDILPSGEITSGRELAEMIISHNMGSKMILAELPSKFPSGAGSRPLGIMRELISPQPKTITTYRTGASPSLEDYFVFYVMRGMPRLLYRRDFFSEHVVSYYSSALTNTGLYRAGLGDFERARRLYLEALSISGDSSAAWNNLGTLYFARGDYGPAALNFEIAYRLEPANSSSKVNAGMAYSRMGNFDRARTAFEEALRQNFNPTAANELGLMRYARGDYASAEKIFSDIIAREPSFAAARYNMGLALSKTRPSEAQRYFEEYERMTRR